MFTLNFRDNAEEVSRFYEDVEKRQLPFATARALTLTAGEVRSAEYDEMRRVFDRPTPYTLNSLFVKPAKKGDLAARVWLKDTIAGKGVPATKYLAPQIEGGARRLKGFERMLMRRGLLPTGWMAVPGSAAKLDAYGNMQRGQLIQALSALQAFGEVGYDANRTAQSRKRRGRRQGQFFVGRPGGGKLPMGVWQRFQFGFGSAIKPVLIFVRGPRYQRRLDFFGVAERTASRRFPENMHESLRLAVATAR